MRRLAPLIICLLVLFAAAYIHPGHTQNRRKTTHRAKPTPTPDSENVLDLIPEETPTPTPTPEWDYILSQHGVTYAYNTRRITRSDEGIVRIWFKKTPTGEAREDYLQQEAVRRLSAAGRDYTNYTYTLLLEDFDCKSARWRKVNAVDYDRNGRVIFLFNFEQVGLRWEDVIPESVGEELFAVACGRKE